MKKLTWVGIVALSIGLFFAASETSAQNPLNKPVNLRFASFSVGGSWYIYAVNISEIIKPFLPAGSKIEVLPYQGGAGNPILVSKGDADLGLSFSTSSNWAYKGIVAYTGRKKMDNLRAIVGGLNKPHRLTIIARKDAKLSSIQEIKDQQRKVRLVTVQRGGAGEALARQVLEAYGMTYDDLIKMGGGCQPH
jgi:TRAP transporter TAXI family solute receptor